MVLIEFTIVISLPPYFSQLSISMPFSGALSHVYIKIIEYHHSGGGGAHK